MFGLGDNDNERRNYGQQSYPDSTGTSYGQVPGRFDDDEVTQNAMSHYGAQDDDSRSMFQNALSMAQSRFQNNSDDDDFDEQGAVQAHQNMYNGGGGGGSEASSSTLGAAGAMQALKMFTGGNGQSAPQSQSGFMGIAMAEAGKLFDQQNEQGNASGNKESAMQEAAQMALKMYMKSQAQSAGGLMGLASKFM